MPARTFLVALAAAAALLLGACTQPQDDSSEEFQGEQRNVAQAVEDLEDAGSRRDAEEICATLLTAGLRTKVEQATGRRRSCKDALENALEDADAFKVDVEKVTVQGNRATATVVSDAGDDDRRGELTLVKVQNTWRLDSFAG